MATTKKFTSNKKPWNKMKRRLLSSNATRAKVGYFDTVYTTGRNRGTPVAYIAQLNNEGIGVPARDFFHHSIADFKTNSSVRELSILMMNDVARGNKTKQNVMKHWGGILKEIVETSIIYWVNPENRASTVNIKGKDDPLRETDRMLNSVKVKVSRSKDG